MGIVLFSECEKVSPRAGKEQAVREGARDVGSDRQIRVVKI